jgi:hypothetical protein
MKVQSKCWNCSEWTENTRQIEESCDFCGTVNNINWLRIYKLELIILFLGCLHQVLQKIVHLKIVWVDSYGDDLLAVPFVSASVLIMENFLVYQNHTRKHSFSQLLFLFVFISVVFEFIIPKYSQYYTYDLIDILYYFIGFIAYYFAKKNLDRF